MQIIEAIESRHSVRSFSEKMPEKDILIQLEEEIKKINEKNALHFQVVPGEEKAFSGFMARYGKFSGVKNYIAVAGKNSFSELPDWFERGVKAALLAPTAMNQQKFKFCLDGTKVTLKKGRGFETKIDFGIVKYHFEAAAVEISKTRRPVVRFNFGRRVQDD